jgi:hypothetical protein
MRDKLYIGELNGVQLDFTTGSFTDIHNITGHIRDAVLTQSVSSAITGFAPSSDAIYKFVTGVSGYLDAHNSLYSLSADIGATANTANIVLTPEDGNSATSVLISGGNGIDVARNNNTITVSHTDTSNVNSFTNSSGVLVQSLSFDTFGHVTGFTSVDLDERYNQIGSVSLDDVTDIGNVTTNSITVGDVTASKLTITGVSEGAILAPATLYIDPATHNNIAGKVVILGDLDIRGNTTYINSTDVQIGDKNIILATGATEAQADGAGFTISGTQGTYGSFTYSSSNDRFESSLPIYSTGGFLGNATTATSLQTPIYVAITGDATGITTNFDGSSNLTVSVEVIDGSHDHIIANISGLQSALDSKTNNTTDVIAGSGLLGGGVLTGNITLNVGQGNGLSVGADNISTVSDQSHLNKIQIGDDQTNIGGGTNTTYGGIVVARARGTSASAVALTENGSGSGDVIAIAADSTLTFDGIVSARNEDANNANGADSAAWKVMGVLEKDSDSVNVILSQVTQIAKGSNAQNWTISLSAGTAGLALQGNGEASKNIVWSTTLNYNVITA